MSVNEYLDKTEQNKQIYILRYYLPCEPIYDKTVVERRCDDLVEYCCSNKIQAVMLYVDLYPYWYYLPDSLEHTEYYVEIVKILANRLRDIGVSYQLNYQNLFGAWDGGVDMRYVNGWENYVDQYGNDSWGVGCSLGKKFRRIAGEKLKIWAETKPDIIWIDDDIRFHNHRTSIHKVYTGYLKCEELDFGCFCENHINEFNRLYGLSATRNQLHQGILSGGDLRQKWLDFCRVCANDVAQWIQNIVGEVSPDTTVALMTSCPDNHAIEGRHWGEFLKNLSGDKTPVMRAHFGPYCECAPNEFFECYNLIEQLKVNIKLQFDGEFEFCPEVENTRFSVWSKSLAATKFQLMLSAYLGCKGITLSLYDLEGGLLGEYPEFAELLQQVRPFCDLMAKENLWNADSIGVAFITSPDRVGEQTFKKDVSSMAGLQYGRVWDSILIKCGIPCKYTVPEDINKDYIFAVDQFSAGLLRDEEVIEILSKSVILDAGAAKCLQDRGFGKYLGVKIGEKVNGIAATEAFNDFYHADDSEMRLPIRIDGGKWNELFLNGATEKSRYVTPCGKYYTGTAIYSNVLGGTILTFAGNDNMGDGFFSTYRIKWLKSKLLEMTNNKLPQINNRSYALMAVKETDDKCYVFIANMSADAINDIEINLPCDVTKGIKVDSRGNICDIVLKEKRGYFSNVELNLYEGATLIFDKK